MRGAFLKTMVAALCLLACAGSADARRIALVIGNGAYEHATRLQNPTNDATDIAAALKRLDFEVLEGRDLGTDKFDAAVQDFTRKSVGADLALFYYSGHGLQFDGANYLVPVDARIDSITALKRRSVTAQDVVDQMERGAKASLVFLDACRNNTLTRDLAQSLPELTRTSAVSRGLARMTGNGNSLIAFAAAPNDVAADGTGQRNSPFTAAVLKHIETPNIVVPEMLTEVTADVVRVTNSRQKPEVLSRLVTQVRMRVASLVVVPSPQIVIPTPPLPEPSREREASVAWEALKESCDRDALVLFRRRYADTFFGDMARLRNEAIVARTVCLPPTVSPATPDLPASSAAPQLPSLVMAPTPTPVPAQTVAPPPTQTTPGVSPSGSVAAQPRTSTKDDVRLVTDLQKELKRIGCYEAEIDGKWGSASEAALARMLASLGKPTAKEPKPLDLETAKSAPTELCKSDSKTAGVSSGALKSSPVVASPKEAAQKSEPQQARPATRSGGQGCVMFAGKCY